jgi:hypothetical protein
MALYLYIFFENGRVIEVQNFEAPDHGNVSALAAKLADGYGNCTNVEVWTRGKKVHTNARAAPGKS